MDPLSSPFFSPPPCGDNNCNRRCASGRWEVGNGKAYVVEGPVRSMRSFQNAIEFSSCNTYTVVNEDASWVKLAFQPTWAPYIQSTIAHSNILSAELIQGYA